MKPSPHPPPRDCESTYAAIEQEPAEHCDIVSRFTHGVVKTGQVTAATERPGTDQTG